MRQKIALVVMLSLEIDSDSVSMVVTSVIEIV